MRTAELTGAELDMWVARAAGGNGKIVMRVFYIDKVCVGSMIYSPSTDWSQGGVIQEREKIGVIWSDNQGCWVSGVNGRGYSGGDTPLQAAMRCFVASKYGDEVPDEETKA